MAYFISWISVLIVLSLIGANKGLTIKQVIESRNELKALSNYMKNLDFFKNELDTVGQKVYTFFAPNNSAFLNIPEWPRTRYLSGSMTSTAKNELQEIFKYHTAYASTGDVIYSTSDMGNQKVHSYADGSLELFFRTIDNNYFVNGARLLPDLSQNIPTDNGLVHIIDGFFWETADTDNALTFLKDRQSGDPDMTFQEFNRLLTEYEEYMGRSHPGDINAINRLNAPKVTLFLPSDTALRPIQSKLIKLASDNKEALRKVIESHVIYGESGVYHSSLLTETLTAMEGQIIPNYFGNQLYVSNQCAKGTITKANITVENGVIHIIDGLLGFVYSDIMGRMLEFKQQDANDFYIYVSGVVNNNQELGSLISVPSTTTAVPDERLVTMFAPFDDNSFTSADIFGSASIQENVVRMHMLRGRIDLTKMTNGTRVETFRPGYLARFYQLPNGDSMDTYVEVNYVRARITEGDMCVTNGILHKTDHVLGAPTRNIWEYIVYESEVHNNLRSVYRAILETGMDTVLQSSNKRVTFFAATDHAFEVMRQGANGLKLLQQDNTEFLRNVMYRHLSEGEFVYDTIGSSSRDITSMFNNEKITAVREGDNHYILFNSQKIPVVMADIRLKNGILHIIDAVLYSESPDASEWTSAAPKYPLSLLLYTLCAMFHMYWSSS